MSVPGVSAAVSPDEESQRLAEVIPLPAAMPEAPPWRRRLAGNLAWNAASELAARGASLWVAFACARVLTVSAFGRFSFALALTQYIWLAGDALASAGYATREVARVRGTDLPAARRLKGRILLTRLAAAAALTALTALVLIAAPMPAELRGALAGGALFYLSYAAFPDWALRAREDFRGLALANVAAAAALVAGTLAWLPRHPDAGTAAGLWSASFAVAGAITLARLIRRGAFTWKVDARDVGPGTRRSLVFAVGAIGGIGCAQAPMLLVGLFSPAHDAGLFGAGYRLLLVVINALSVLWWPLLPVLVSAAPGSRQFRDGLATMGGIVLLLGLPAMLAYTMWPRELLTIAFGARYAEGAVALRVAGFAAPLVAAQGLLEQACLALGGEKIRARANALAFAVLVGTGLALLPRFGLAGAAFGLVAGLACTVTIYVVVYRSVLPWPELFARARVPVALNAALALAWMAARAASLPALPTIAASALVYVGAAVAFGAVPRDMLKLPGRPA